MKTDVNQFWNFFQSIQSDLINAVYSKNVGLSNILFQELLDTSEKYHPKLSLEFSVKTKVMPKAKLTFLHRGNKGLRKSIIALLQQSPQLPNWKFQLGIKPYKGSFADLCLEKNRLNPEFAISQFLVHVNDLYKTSNKFYLSVYVDTISIGVPKFALNYVVEDLMVSYLGEDAYFENVSRFKVVRRKFSRMNFITMYELKDRIQYKVLN